MLRLSKAIYNQAVVSLRTGGQIAVATAPIINPHNLKILGWWCREPAVKDPVVLLSEDLRDFTPKGLAVNDEAALTATEDLVRHKEVLETHFQLLGKLVRTKRGRVGKVSDFSFGDDLFVQKLYVDKSLVKVFTTENTLLIGRDQILEVTDRYILVNDTEVKATESEALPDALPAI